MELLTFYESPRVVSDVKLQSSARLWAASEWGGDDMPLDPGWSAIFGAVIGALATILGSALTHHLQSNRANSLAAKRRERLRQLLSGKKYVWRSIETLAAAIGADEQTTCELLIEIDARASVANQKSWALISRAPWPADLQPAS